MYRYLTVVSDVMNKRSREVETMETFMSPLECPSGLIPYLADAIAVGVDDYEPEEFQRSITNNAVQYYEIKGTRQAYRIRGLMSGFDVEVTWLWMVDDWIADTIQGDNKFESPPGSGHFVSRLSPSEVSGVSGSVPFYGDCTFCLTAFIGLRFILKKAPSGGFPINVLDRIVEKITEIMPIHVRALYIELRIEIEVDMAVEEINCLAEETSYNNVGFNHRFDLWPADVVPLDIGVNVGGYVDEIPFP